MSDEHEGPWSFECRTDVKLLMIYRRVLQRTLHKDRTGGDLFLFTHLTVEVSVLFIYLARRGTFDIPFLFFIGCPPI